MLPIQGCWSLHLKLSQTVAPDPMTPLPASPMLRVTCAKSGGRASPYSESSLLFFPYRQEPSSPSQSQAFPGAPTVMLRAPALFPHPPLLLPSDLLLRANSQSPLPTVPPKVRGSPASLEKHFQPSKTLNQAICPAVHTQGRLLWPLEEDHKDHKP